MDWKTYKNNNENVNVNIYQHYTNGIYDKMAKSIMEHITNTAPLTGSYYDYNKLIYGIDTLKNTPVPPDEKLCPCCDQKPVIYKDGDKFVIECETEDCELSAEYYSIEVSVPDNRAEWDLITSWNRCVSNWINYGHWHEDLSAQSTQFISLSG